MNKSLTLLAIVSAAVAASGCSTGMRQAIGAEKVAPDEFRVVTRAPLVLPPDYALRPPKPGEARPQELRPDRQARAAVFGQETGADASPGEMALVSRAGAEAVDPAIRAQVDLEGGSLVRKTEPFADRVLGFRGSMENEATPLDAEAERKRLAEQESARRATGGQPVVIQPADPDRFKLPGL
jgi:hypothetical protein